jgi:transcriptional regulator EpsA
MAETASAVMRRSQFFVWSQGSLSALLPHQVLCCGAYLRPQRALGFMAFQSVVVSAPALAPLADANSDLMRACVAAWVQAGARPLQLETSHQPLPAQEQLVRLERELRGVRLLVHGVARPQRPAEIESLFVFLHTADAAQSLDERLLHAELVVPYLHATWRRVVAAEAMLAPGAADTPAGPGAAGRASTAGGALTEREREILRWAREGKSNLEIGAALDISALTVKNHIQKILRKLSASNRAHAVALAMSQGLL